MSSGVAKFPTPTMPHHFTAGGKNTIPSMPPDTSGVKRKASNDDHPEFNTSSSLNAYSKKRRLNDGIASSRVSLISKHVPHVYNAHFMAAICCNAFATRQYQNEIRPFLGSNVRAFQKNLSDVFNALRSSSITKHAEQATQTIPVFVRARFTQEMTNIQLVENFIKSYHSTQDFLDTLDALVATPTVDEHLFNSVRENVSGTHHSLNKAEAWHDVLHYTDLSLTGLRKLRNQISRWKEYHSLRVLLDSIDDIEHWLKIPPQRFDLPDYVRDTGMESMQESAEEKNRRLYAPSPRIPSIEEILARIKKEDAEKERAAALERIRREAAIRLAQEAEAEAKQQQEREDAARRQLELREAAARAASDRQRQEAKAAAEKKLLDEREMAAKAAAKKKLWEDRETGAKLAAEKKMQEEKEAEAKAAAKKKLEDMRVAAEAARKDFTVAMQKVQQDEIEHESAIQAMEVTGPQHHRVQSTQKTNIFGFASSRPQNTKPTLFGSSAPVSQSHVFGTSTDNPFGNNTGNLSPQSSDSDVEMSDVQQSRRKGRKQDSSGPRTRNPVLCKFEANGSCTKGGKCNYTHSWDVLPEPQMEIPCYHFFFNGSCRYGSQCRMSHDVAQFEAAQMKQFPRQPQHKPKASGQGLPMNNPFQKNSHANTTTHSGPAQTAKRAKRSQKVHNGFDQGTFSSADFDLDTFMSDSDRAETSYRNNGPFAQDNPFQSGSSSAKTQSTFTKKPPRPEKAQKPPNVLDNLDAIISSGRKAPSQTASHSQSKKAAPVQKQHPADVFGSYPSPSQPKKATSLKQQQDQAWLNKTRAYLNKILSGSQEASGPDSRAQKPCRNGVRCTRPNCIFKHE